MSVYDELIKRNIITQNEDGSVSFNYKQALEDEIKSTQIKKEKEEETYRTYNIIAISSFIFILIITFLLAFHLGKKKRYKENKYYE